MSSFAVPLEPPSEDTSIHYGRFDEAAGQVPAYKWWAVFNILCCCLPLGVVAAYFSGEVEERLAKRDFEGAKNASKVARNLNIICLLCGLAGYSALIYYIVQSSQELSSTSAPYIVG
ncbi:hypothetical protein NDU88_000316 [Pleurodeles waltl]|uniref:Uncharacterized protein n=1 Tax=Pleurodeles waltl TaxID=8319 RepID=A0AAV7TF42_PLEWA|nr:hypothetical protein NDU88_000316 [Pleurodeles waltl]